MDGADSLSVSGSGQWQAPSTVDDRRPPLGSRSASKCCAFGHHGPKRSLLAPVTPKAQPFAITDGPPMVDVTAVNS